METLLAFLRDHPNQVTAFIAVCALFVSLISILLTFLALILQRRHNFKSLTPIAHIPVSDYENLIAVKLKNTGVGPLIVEQFRASDDNREEDDIISWMPNTPEGIAWDTFYESLDGLSIPPNKEAVVIKLSGDSHDTKFVQFRDDVRRALSKLKVRVKYKDIYNRNLPEKERDLKWFGRHF